MDESKHGLIIDLNKYRPGRSLRQLLDLGVDGFIFRIGGPAAWNEGSWGYAEDPTWRGYLEQADRVGIPREQIGGYIIHNPFEDWRLDHNAHLDLLNQWTGGGYQPGYYIVDHEIAACWRGSTKITATPYNLTSSLAALMDKLWKTKRRAVMVYTARWFLNGNGPLEHTTLLDNINSPAAGKQWCMWYAAYLQQSLYAQKCYANARDALADLQSPTGEAVGKYLQCGSYSLWDLWQFTNTLKLGDDAQGVDASVTRGTIDEYWALVGAKAAPPPEPDPQPEPDAEEDLLLGALAEIDEKLGAILAKLGQVFR